MSRRRLTDEKWDIIEDVFPPPAATGRPPISRRNVKDGIRIVDQENWLTMA